MEDRSALQDFIVEANEGDPSYSLHQAHNEGDTLQVKLDGDYGIDDEDIPSPSRKTLIPIRTLQHVGVSMELKVEPIVEEGEI